MASSNDALPFLYGAGSMLVGVIAVLLLMGRPRRVGLGNAAALSTDWRIAEMRRLLTALLRVIVCGMAVSVGVLIGARSQDFTALGTALSALGVGGPFMGYAGFLYRSWTHLRKDLLALEIKQLERGVSQSLLAAVTQVDADESAAAAAAPVASSKSDLEERLRSQGARRRAASRGSSATSAQRRRKKNGASKK